MKKKLLISLISLLTISVSAQYVSQPISIHMEKNFVAPYLEVIDGSINFFDANGDSLINANEQCYISLQVRNTGKGNAQGCVAKINAEGTTQGLEYKNTLIPIIAPGETKQINFPITASLNTANGKANFTIQVTEPNGFGTEEYRLSVGTRRFLSPMVEIVSYKIASEGNAQLRKKKPFKVQLMLQNTDFGVAKDVVLEVKVPENMFLQDGYKEYRFDLLQPNEKKTIELEFLSNQAVSDNLDLKFLVSESTGQFAKNATIPLKFGQSIGSTTTTMTIAGHEQNKEHVQITRGSLLSDVDENIPQNEKQNKNTFVLIIANENYQQVAPVRFALNDGNTFRSYCQRTLGIANNQIHYIANATGNQMKTEINWIQGVVKVFDNAHVIVYYAGHGVPDEKNMSAYLLPVDGYTKDLTTCYKLDDLYNTLGNMGAEKVTIFMDACFSGSKREEGMLASARGVAIKAKQGVPQGNMVVFSAAQGDETAYPFETQQHGMFTYYLLKYLQQTKGEVLLKELGEYITRNVSQQSILENSKSQTPCVIPSSTVSSKWENWTLR